MKNLEKNIVISQDEIVNHLKNYGFIYQNSEIYNGLSNAWDMGPLGALLKNNLKNLWIDFFIISQKNMSLIDTNIILNPLVWKASGHIDNFSDPLIDCKSCKSRFRVDKLIENNSKKIVNEKTSLEEFLNIINQEKIKCPNCKKFDWTDIRYFNLMFETKIGVLDDKKNIVYLRPETAQGIYINFKNVLRTSRYKIPFGIGQIGKSFRNEITPGNFIFRMREFEQMEIEYFVEEKDEEKYFNYFKDKINDFLTNILKINSSNLKIISYKKDEIAHYAKKTIDFFYNFPHGESELWGLCNRGSYDLIQHQTFSKKSLEAIDENNNKFLPSIIEPSVGVERLLYAILLDSYYKEKIVNGEERVILKLNYKLSPYKICILPLQNDLVNKSNEIFEYFLQKNISCNFDKSGSIGKRYRRQDAMGTYFCLTVDYNSLSSEKFSLRIRDSMKQILNLSKEEIFEKLSNFNEKEINEWFGKDGK